MSVDPPPRSRGVPDRRPSPVVRKDAEGERTIGTTWESVTERIIREAQERGDFDDLPSRGRPLVVDENPYAGDMSLAYHMLRNAGVAPPWIESDKEVRRLAAVVEGLLRRAHRAPLPIRATLRRELERLVADHDGVVMRLNAEAPTVRNHRRPIGRAAALAALDAAIAGEAPASSDTSSALPSSAVADRPDSPPA